MKHFLLAISIFVLSACGGGSDTKDSENNDSAIDAETFTLQNIRFDSKDYYEGEDITVTRGTRFEVQWVSPIAAPYRIDLYLSANGDTHADKNKIVGLRCGKASFSLCPNVTGEVQCEIDNNTLSCSIGSDPVGSETFEERYLSSLRFIIKGCDEHSNCDVKTFNLLVENNLGD